MKFPRVIIAVLLLGAAPLLAEDFYEQQLRSGQSDAAAGRLVQAADELRVAAFGFLDRPPLLSRALVHLALVQNALSQPAAVKQTLERFLEVEQRFASYATAEIDAKTRAAFEALLFSSEPPSALSGIKSLSRLTRSDVERVSDLPPSQRQAAYEQGFRKASRDIRWPLAAARDAASRNADDEVIRWARQALGIDRQNGAARAMLVHALTRRGDCRGALRELAALPDAQKLQSADMAGDGVVCLVAESRWADAETASQKLPEEQKQRGDVAKALQTLSARKPQPAASFKPPAVSKPAPATAPPAAAPASVPTQTPATTSAQTSSASQETPATRPSAAVTQQRLTSARSLIEAGKFGDAARYLQTVVKSDPNNRALRLALLEAAALSQNWLLAVSQVPLVSPFADGEEVSMFYAAAALFENGRKADAAALIRRAKPKLMSSPFVDYYSKATGIETSPK